MSTLYEYEIKSRNPKLPHDSVTRIRATSISEAKNKFKSLQPEYKIISCVKLGEVYDPRKPPKSSSKEKDEGGSSITAALIGAAVTGLVGLLLKNK